jgi:hypothetical protein
MNIDLINIFGDAPVLGKHGDSEGITASDAFRDKKVVGLFFNKWTGPTVAK